MDHFDRSTHHEQVSMLLLSFHKCTKSWIILHFQSNMYAMTTRGTHKTVVVVDRWSLLTDAQNVF